MYCMGNKYTFIHVHWYKVIYGKKQIQNYNKEDLECYTQLMYVLT